MPNVAKIDIEKELVLLKSKKRSMMYTFITPNTMNAHTKRIAYSDRLII